MPQAYVKLSKNEIHEIFAAIRNGCEHTREAFIVKNVPLVKSIARKLSYLKPPHIDMEDMIGEGKIGLIKAVDRYDPDKGAFSTHAYYWIQATIREFLIQTDSSPKPERKVAKAIKHLNSIYLVLIQELGREPTYHDLVNSDLVQNLAASIDKTPSELLLAARDLSTPASLDQPVDIEGLDIPYINLIPDRTESPENIAERRDLLEHLFKPLSSEDRLIISHYFGINGHEQLNTRELGELLGQTQQSISQKKVKIIAHLKKAAKQDAEIQAFRSLA